MNYPKDISALRKMSNSGSELRLGSEGLNFFVHKSYEGNNHRNILSVYKQLCFEDLQLEKIAIKSAKVNQIESVGHSFTIKMPFYHGLVGHDYIIHGSRDDFLLLKSGIDFYIKSIFAKSIVKNVDSSVFLDKLDEIDSKVSDLFSRRCVQKLKDYISYNFKFIEVPVGVCHGDLTLSNIIQLSNGDLIFLDFLDAYLESPLQDIVKLRQDFFYGWSMRNSTSELKLNFKIFAKYFKPDALTVFDKLYRTQINIFMMICLLRICPYVTDENTYEWLVNALRNECKNF